MSIRSVQQQIDSALANDYLSAPEARRVVAEAERGTVTDGERQLVRDLLDWASPGRGQPLPVRPRSSEAARSVLQTFLIGKGEESPLLVDMQLVASRVSCTAGGSEADGECEAFSKQGPFSRLDEASFRAAFSSEIDDALTRNENLADDDELSIEPATAQKIEDMFSDAYDTKEGGVAALQKLAAKLADPVVVMLGDGDNGEHPVWLVGRDENDNLVGLRSSVVWT